MGATNLSGLIVLGVYLAATIPLVALIAYQHGKHPYDVPMVFCVLAVLWPLALVAAIIAGFVRFFEWLGERSREREDPSPKNDELRA